MHQFRFIVRTALLLLLLHPVVATQQAGIVLEEPQQQTSSHDARKLQQSAYNYRANYTADFLHLLDPSCTGDVPELYVICPTAQNMTILGTSHESINCIQFNLGSTAFPDALTYRCRNTCNSTLCNSIFISTYIEGPYGSIQFMCEGNDYQQVEAAYVFDGGSNGSCNATSTGKGRNLHVSRLGVSCPSETSGEARRYVYDDAYFECSFTGSTDAYGTAFDSTGDPSDVYTCLTGNDCVGNACSDVLFNDIVIRSVVPTFLLPCVETTFQSITAIPSQSPIVPVASDTIYNVRFEALWANLYDSQTSLMTCRYDNIGVQISCGNSATAIRFNSSTDPSMFCTNVNDIALHCIGDETKIKSQFTSVIYVSCSCPLKAKCNQ